MAACAPTHHAYKHTHTHTHTLQWITEDTRAELGRESKFLRFNILPCAPNGVGSAGASLAGSSSSSSPAQPSPAVA